MMIPHRNQFPSLMERMGVRSAVEAGTAESYFARQLLQCKTLERLYLVDVEITASTKMLAETDSRVRLLESKSVDAAKAFIDGSVDMVYVDASHEYADVRDDLRVWGHVCRRLFAGHDYMPHNPAFGQRGWPCGVMRAVEEYFGRRNSIWVTGAQEPTLEERIRVVEETFALEDFGVFGEHIPSWYVIL